VHNSVTASSTVRSTELNGVDLSCGQTGGAGQVPVLAELVWRALQMSHSQDDQFPHARGEGWAVEDFVHELRPSDKYCRGMRE
jgi:hypothetical protein